MADSDDPQLATDPPIVEKSPAPKRRPKVDRSVIPLSEYLPSKNRAARRAYQSVIYGMIPGLGLFLGPVALILGVIGWKRLQRQPDLDGKLHCRVSMFVGPLQFVCNLVGYAAIFHGLGWL